MIPAASAVDDQSDESNSATAVYKQSAEEKLSDRRKELYGLTDEEKRIRKYVEDGHKLFKSSERKMDDSEVLLNDLIDEARGLRWDDGP